MKNKLISFILFTIFCFFSLSNIGYTKTENEEFSYTSFRSIDKGTFNEYRYKITEQYFILRDHFKINGSIKKETTDKILKLAIKGYNHLPDNLANKNYLNKLLTALKRGLKHPENESNYSAIIRAIREYLEEVNIKSITGKIEINPKSGNAPLTVTLRGRVIDPTGTSIPNYNYVWWMDKGGERKIIGNKISISYTFKQEGNFSVFLYVKSNHKNEKGYADVLPFSSRKSIEIREKVASLIIKVNSTNLRQKEVLKFTPQEANYGLIFDATSSTPTSGGKFISTEWDFGNGLKRENTGGPRIERVKYGKEGDFSVKLTLKTNELQEIERKFVVSIRNPIASINSSLEQGFLGDKFTFSARPSGNDDDLTYSWEIIDIDKDKIIFNKNASLFTYSFKNKGKYNVRLKISEASGETDIDTKIIYINSRAPVADFYYEIPNKNKPNRVFLDATKSYDPDFGDDGRLNYSWIINGERTKLKNPNFNGASGYYRFDSIGKHSVVLEVSDPDNISSQKKEKVDINSILSVEFSAFPRIIQRNGFIRFIANSPEAKFYEWDFGDGSVKGGLYDKIKHKYEKSGIFSVKLKVTDNYDNENTFKKTIYVGESNKPLAFIGIESSNSANSSSEVVFRKDECFGKGAYIANRVNSVRFSATESINIDGENSNLEYSWKIGNDKYFSSRELSYKFDEIGCFPIKLTVKSKDNRKSHTTKTWVKVENLKPILSSLDIIVGNIESDPVVVNVSALGAKDKDGVIQSYLWYYYTDIDPEPQDFRATNIADTTFVLSKITGNYYFVVVMKDNNEDRITSEEITGGKNSITIVGDNINTPLIDLRVDDSSVSVGDEVVFNAVVKNILKQDISHKVSYSWDIDGDGFYDKKTSSPSFSYTFSKSGEFHSKLKVSYKGFSNTKSLTINVANRLVSDFSYISIGDKYIFLNKSSGKIDKYIWDMGDGKKIEKKDSFVYLYNDKKANHKVELKISEGTKIKKTSKKVLRNLRNKLYARKPGLNIFTHPKISKDGNIVIEKNTDKLYIYAIDNNIDTNYYSIDYDVNLDSDLNGGKDDDIDNKNTPSYKTGGPIEINLNDNKIQKIRIFTTGKDSSSVIDSVDLKITKNYIDSQDINIDYIDFKGVSDSIKIKIEKLKEMLKSIPPEYKLKAFMYVQKLQEEWFDETERTRVIIEFEGFLDSFLYPKNEDIIILLESLLVEGEEDKSEKNILYTALKTLIPKNIICDFSEGFSDCYSNLINKLEEIKFSGDVEKNRKIGSELLNVIKIDTGMTNKQKLDFKSILQAFVYGGVENIPQKIVKETEAEDKNNNNSFLSLVKKVISRIFLIIFLFIGIIFIYWLYYKFTNNNKSVGFQEFIIDKTRPNTEKNTITSMADVIDDKNDILDDIGIDEPEEVGAEEEVKNETDVLENPFSKDLSTPVVPDSDTISDPLDTNFSSEVPLDLVEEKVSTEEIVGVGETNEDFKEEEEIKEDFKDNGEVEKIETSTEKEPEPEMTENLDSITKIEEDKLPDWLKGSISNSGRGKQDDTGSKDFVKADGQDDNESIEEVEVLKEGNTLKIDELDNNIPDWLKGSLLEDDKNVSPKDNFGEKTTNTFKTEKQNISESKTNKVTEKESQDLITNSTNVSELQTENFTEVEKNSTTKVESDISPDLKNKNIIKESKITDESVRDNKKNSCNVAKSVVDTDVTKNNYLKPKNKTKNSRKTPSKIEKIEKLDDNNLSEKINKGVTDKIEEEKKEKIEKKTKQSDRKQKNGELWKDGMNVPDWLQTGENDKKNSKK